MGTVVKLLFVALFIIGLHACGGAEFDAASADDSTIPPELPNASPSPPQFSAGKNIYSEQCAVCHGDKGQGGAAGGNLQSCSVCGDFERLASHIQSTMPVGNPAACDANCSQTVAAYILEDLSTIYTPIDGQPTSSNSSSSSSSSSSSGSASPDPLLGETLWKEKSCDGCHGQEPGEPADTQVREAIANSTFVTKTNSTMPLGAPGACDLECSKAISTWLQTIYPVDSSGPGDDVFIVPDITPDQNALMKSLHKLSLSLAFTMPTQSWIELVKNQKEAGLEAVVREVMEGDNFYFRLGELYRPILQGTDIPSNAYAENIGGRANWFNDFKGINDNAGRYARWEIWGAINNEPYRLIEHVIRNDLPFTEILTADYTLVNYFSARSYNVLDQVSFTEIEFPAHAEFPHSPWEYKKAYLPIPTAGILTSSVFVTIYPTTGGNVNRHRANTVFKLFLDTDILDIPGSRVEADDITVDHPTLNNPSCTGCHNVMDPVASAFRHWQLGEKRQEQWWQAGWNQEAILPPGFNGVEMPEDNPAPLPWLAEQIAKDPRFALSAVKTFFTEVTGHPVLPIPDPLADQMTLALYNHQQEKFQDFADRFIQNGYKVKDLIVDLVLSDYFRNEEYLGGTSRLISNIQLKRKVEATLGVRDWGASHWVMNDSSYAGDQPNGMMALLQRLAGSEVACLAVPQDMAKPINERRLLAHYVAGEVVNDAGLVSADKELEIKKNLSNLMWVMWGQTVQLDDPNLISLYALYLEIITTGKQALKEGIPSNIDQYCEVLGHDGVWVSTDEHYVIRAWIGVVNVMIDDFRFLYD